MWEVCRATQRQADDQVAEKTRMAYIEAEG